MDYSFGTWIKRRRKALDLTQQALAQKVGCSVSAIFKFESDERRPSRQIAQLLATHLEIPPDQINLFLKVARQEKTVDHLDSLPPPPLSGTAADQTQGGPVPVPERPRSNLPPLLDPLVGREFELEAISHQLRDPQCRLLTLTGLGGVGKTRLALEAAHRMAENFVGGAYFISLAGVADPEYIVPTTVNSLGLAAGSSDQKSQIFNYLRDRDALLVFDNLEHLLADHSNIHVADFLNELVQQTSQVKIITTSRQQLQIQAEWTLEVQGLPVPQILQADGLESNSSVRLFLQRARHARVGFTLTENDWPAVTRICQLVEGLPLGIELAAAWVRTLSCREIAEELEKGLSILSVNLRDLPERQRSWQATMDYSWSLLSSQEQHVLAWLSIFKGDFDRQAAEQVADATLPLLASLVEKSLLHHMKSGRYDLHELIRQYSMEQLSKLGELDAACERHLDFFLKFVEETGSKLYGTDQIRWLDRLEQENDHLRAALEWSLRGAGRNPQKSLRLAGALFLFWKRRDHWKEGREWLRRALDQSAGLQATREQSVALNAAALLAAEQADTQSASQLAQENLKLARTLGNLQDIAAALNTLGFVLWKQKNFAAARSHCEQSLALFREIGDQSAVADALHALSHITINQGDLEAAQTYLHESLSISQGLDNKIGMVEAMGDLGLVAYLRNDYVGACSFLNESMTRYQEANLIPGIVSVLNRLGDLARCEDDYDTAEKLYADALSLYREFGDLDELPSILHNLGYVVLRQGNQTAALKYFKEALAIQNKTGNRAGVAECLMGVASVLVEQTRPEDGACLLGAAEVLREAVGVKLWPANLIEYDRSLTLLRQTLDESAITKCWQAGRAMSIEQAVALANEFSTFPNKNSIQ